MWRTRKGAHGPARTNISQLPFGQVQNPFEPMKVISDDQVEALHIASLKVLSEIGMDFQLPATNLSKSKHSLKSSSAFNMIERIRNITELVEALSCCKCYCDVEAFL
jgi:trimethylamine:corrinoid methyltransferase-like protein